MNIKLLCIILLIANNANAQISNNTNPLNVSKLLLAKAIWYQNMPQYNSDSSEIYFEKAINICMINKKYYATQLANIYLQRLNILTINHSLHFLDSLGTIGWQHLQTSLSVQPNDSLEYNYCVAWAFIKLENGEHKKALDLFVFAITIAKKFERTEQKMIELIDKSYFYERYTPHSEPEIVMAYLVKSKTYFESIGKEKKAIELFRIYRNIISYYSESNKDSLLFYSNKMKNILPDITIPQCHAWYYLAIGRDLITFSMSNDTAISKAQYKLGKANILKSISILDSYKINQNNMRPYTYGLLADLYLINYNYDAAIANFKKSKLNYALIQNKKSEIDMGHYLANAYATKGDYKNAYFEFKKYNNEASTFEKEVNLRSLRESELKIDNLNQDKKLVQEQKKQVVFFIIIIVIITLLAFLFWNYKLKQKSNLLLADANNSLASKNNLLDKRNADIELLLKEIHHRVKNNLEVVSSLLALQSAQIDDPNTKEAMLAGQNRVNSIGIVHQKLYQGTNLGAVEMKDYFNNLGESILDSFGAEDRIELELNMENLELDIDTAVPLGLIVNELMTNAIKYAYPDNGAGIIQISLYKLNTNLLKMHVADNGVGKSGTTYGTGFGGQLVALLTQQLNGVMTEENKNGTKIQFDFVMKTSKLLL